MTGGIFGSSPRGWARKEVFSRESPTDEGDGDLKGLLSRFGVTLDSIVADRLNDVRTLDNALAGKYDGSVIPGVVKPSSVGDLEQKDDLLAERALGFCMLYYGDAEKRRRKEEDKVLLKFVTEISIRAEGYLRNLAQIQKHYHEDGDLEAREKKWGLPFKLSGKKGTSVESPRTTALAQLRKKVFHSARRLKQRLLVHDLTSEGTSPRGHGDTSLFTVDNWADTCQAVLDPLLEGLAFDASPPSALPSLIRATMGKANECLHSRIIIDECLRKISKQVKNAFTWPSEKRPSSGLRRPATSASMGASTTPRSSRAIRRNGAAGSHTVPVPPRNSRGARAATARLFRQERAPKERVQRVSSTEYSDVETSSSSSNSSRSTEQDTLETKIEKEASADSTDKNAEANHASSQRDGKNLEERYGDDFASDSSSSSSSSEEEEEETEEDKKKKEDEKTEKSGSELDDQKPRIEKDCLQFIHVEGSTTSVSSTDTVVHVKLSAEESKKQTASTVNGCTMLPSGSGAQQDNSQKGSTNNEIQAVAKKEPASALKRTESKLFQRIQRSLSRLGNPTNFTSEDSKAGRSEIEKDKSILRHLVKTVETRRQEELNPLLAAAFEENEHRWSGFKKALQSFQRKIAGKRLLHFFIKIRQQRRMKRSTSKLRDSLVAEAQADRERRAQFLLEVDNRLSYLRQQISGSGTGYHAQQLNNAWKAAVRIQSNFRRFKGVRAANDRRDAVERLQLLCRRYLSKLRLWKRRALVSVVQEREAEKQWKIHRDIFAESLPLEKKSIELYCAARTEAQRIDREITLEEEGFHVHWDRYEEGVLRKAAKQKVPENWVPQTDPRSGRSYFLNVRTGKVSAEHPEVAIARRFLKKERQNGEAELERRVNMLRRYKVQILLREGKLQEDIMKSMVEFQRQGSKSLNSAMNTQSVLSRLL